MANKGQLTDRATLETVIDDLREGWARSSAGVHRSNHRDGHNDPVRIALILAHTAHVHRLAAAVRMLVDGGLAFEAVALVREAYETAITVCWVAHNPVASQAMVNDYVNKRRVLRDEFAATANGILRDGAAGLKVEHDLVHLTDHDQQAKRFKTLCGDFEPKGNDLYAIYRWLSAYSHPGVKVADRYFSPEGDARTPMTFRAREDEGPPVELLLRMTAISMVWSGSSLNFLERDNKRRDQLRRVARELDCAPYLKLTGAAIQRIERELGVERRARRSAAER